MVLLDTCNVDGARSSRVVSSKKCEFCNSSIPKKNGKFCSNTCQGSHINRELVVASEKGEIKAGERAYRKFLIDRDGAKCSKCGWNEVNPTTGKVPIEMNHKDGNSENTRLDNLELLCPNCHSLTPTFRNLNKGSGRAYRRKNSCT